ncbi:hypothetical protein PV08_08844 [Exophiala spinifera]|uniref:CENP-V/GFA domain-containing protein n=1 Tax=Exophiala spinifera TaxID=91928 RepID=A0A0D2B3Z5_9EURO|nr:uncharacterized protein PV08_08844 [Exophiala spinifera]KIW13653.1 hypothetical protein PV08_08844 [Exophiala spinifera]
MATTGACLCGEVKYQYTGDITAKIFCNCKDCQRWSGGTGLPNVVVDRAKFQITAGTPKTFDIVGDSGKINKHFFCGACGSSMYCEPEVMEDKTCIKCGSLDEPDVAQMQLEIYVKDRVSFQKPMDGAQQVAGGV